MSHNLVLSLESQNIFKILASSNDEKLCWLIGQNNKEKSSIVYHLIRIPTIQKESTEATNVCYGNLGSLTEKMVLLHGKQVHSLLPGGLHILGLLLIGLEKRNDASHDMDFRKLLMSLFKGLAKYPEFTLLDSFDKVFVTSGNDPSCLNCSCVEWKTGKNLPSSVKLEIGKGRNGSLLRLLRSSIVLSGCCSLGIGNKKMSGLIDTLACHIMEGIAVMDGAIVNPSLSLSKISAEQWKVSEDEGSFGQVPYLSVHFFNKGIPANSELERISDLQEFVSIEGGKLECLAYVSSKATVGEAIAALKCDALRSLVCRMNLVSKDLDHMTTGRVHELPCRLLFPLLPSVDDSAQDTQLYLCDFIFSDENRSEVVHRLQEILDVRVKVEQLCCVERAPVLSDCTKKDVPTTHSTNNYFYFSASLGAALVALLAVVSGTLSWFNMAES